MFHNTDLNVSRYRARLIVGPLAVALAMLALMSCAGPSNSGTTYERGTFTAPPPAAVRPGVGAPVVGQPGTPAGYPRGTDARVLPPTREPGVWSAGEPRAVMDEDVPEDPILLGVRLPFSPEAKTAREKAPTRECAYLMGLAVTMRRQSDLVSYLTEENQKCLAAQLYLACAAGEERKLHGGENHKAKHIVSMVMKTAEQFVAESCGVPIDDDVKRILDKVVPIWNQFANVPEAQ